MQTGPAALRPSFLKRSPVIAIRVVPHHLRIPSQSSCLYFPGHMQLRTLLFPARRSPNISIESSRPGHILSLQVGKGERSVDGGPYAPLVTTPTGLSMSNITSPPIGSESVTATDM